MVWLQSFFPYAEGALIKRFGFGIPALGTVKHCQIVKAGGNLEMLLSQDRASA